MICHYVRKMERLATILITRPPAAKDSNLSANTLQHELKNKKSCKLEFIFLIRLCQ